METPDYHPLYLAGIEHFNVCDFFEAHEVWEELWTDEHGPDRKFYQGLIQVAVSLHHFGNGNIRGARKLYLGCQQYLDLYRPMHLGLDLDQLIAELTHCFEEVMASDEDYPSIEVDPERIPEIHLDPPPVEQQA